MKPLREQKNKLFEDMKKIKKGIEDLEYEKNDIKRNLPKDLFKPEEIKTALEKLEQRYKT